MAKIETTRNDAVKYASKDNGFQKGESVLYKGEKAKSSLPAPYLF